MTDPAPSANEEESAAHEDRPQAVDDGADKSVKKGALGVLVLILVSLTWYLLADRFTPYTTQARVQGYVLGVAPKVFDGHVRSIGLGVSAGQAQPPGTLPTIQNNRDWLRQSQRFPVIIGFDVDQDEALRRQLRIGGQADRRR